MEQRSNARANIPHIVRPPATPAKPQIDPFPHLLLLDARAAVAQSAGGLLIFLLTRQRRSGASVAAILGHIASHDRSARQRHFGIEAAPLRSKHRNLTKGLSSHHSLGEGND